MIQIPRGCAKYSYHPEQVNLLMKKVHELYQAEILCDKLIAPDCAFVTPVLDKSLLKSTKLCSD